MKLKRISHEILTLGKAYQTYLTLEGRRTHWLDTDGAGAETCLILGLDDREELEKGGLDNLVCLEEHHAVANGFTHLKVEIRPMIQKINGKTVYTIRDTQEVRCENGKWTSQPTNGEWK